MLAIRKYRSFITFCWLLLLVNTFVFPFYSAESHDPLNSVTEVVFENFLGMEDSLPGDEKKEEGSDPLKSPFKFFDAIQPGKEFIRICTLVQTNNFLYQFKSLGIVAFELHSPPPESLI